MFFSKEKKAKPELYSERKRIWKQFDYKFDVDFVFLDDIKWTKDGVCFILSQPKGKSKTLVQFDGHPYSYRVTEESCYFNPFDCYDNADDLSYKDHKIFFTQESAYLDRFYQQSDMLQKEQDRLYHIQIITEDMIVDVIDDQLPIVFAES